MSNYRKTMTEALQEMVSLDERMRMPRQLIDTNKEVMIVKKNKVIVIDKKDQDKYMKQGWELAEEVGLNEGTIDKVKEIASKKQAMKIDGVMVDSFTASAISQIYDKVNDANKKKMEKLPITKLANLAFKMMQKNEFVPEGKMQDVWQKKNAKSLSVGPFELIRGKSGVHTIKQSGKVIGDFSYDDDADNFVANMKGMKGQWTGNDIDSLFTHLQKVHKEEFELDEGKMSAAQIAKLKKAYEPMRGKKISMASGQKLSSIIDKVDDDKQALSQLVKADIPFVSQLAVTRLITKHGMKGAEIRKMQEEVELDEEFKKGDKVTVKVAKSSDREIQQLSKKFGDTVSGVVMGQSGKILMVKTDKGQINPPVKDVMKEEVELDEASYALYHKDFSSAMQHSYKMAKKMYGITIDPKEIDDKVASGPRKPSEGKTNKYRLKGDKGAIQVQVYNKGGSKPFELNMYKEEVELDEAKGSTKYVVMQGPGDNNQKVIAIFDGGAKALEKAKKFRDDWNKKNKSKIKLDKKGKPIAAHMARIFAKGAETSYKVGDKVSYSEFAPSIVKEEVETEGVDEGAAADARRAMRSDPDMKQRAFSKDVSATDDDEKAASKNIMMQLRKAVSLRSYDVEFADGKKQKVNQKIAQAVQNKYNNMRRPADKEKFQAQIAKSYKDMLKTIKSGYGEQKESILEKIDRKIKENKNG